MDKTVGIIYYTDNRIEGTPIYNRCQQTILAAGLPITSCSLKPIRFGRNFVLEGRQRSYPTMVEQILTALQNAEEDYVFFCEHDVFYHCSHFELMPPSDDVFWYNDNCWRWWYKFDYAIRHGRMHSLSCLCVNRLFALDHYQQRMEFVKAQDLCTWRSREPRQGRIWGYEPGTKPKRRGGFSDDTFALWRSEYPNIDVRHHKCFSSPKICLDDFKHKPEYWEEIKLADIPGWDMAVFDLEKKPPVWNYCWWTGRTKNDGTEYINTVQK